MNGTNDNTCINADLTAQSCIDDIHFRCSQAKGLANCLAISEPDSANKIADTLVELLEDTLDNLSALQRFVGGAGNE